MRTCAFVCVCVCMSECMQYYIINLLFGVDKMNLFYQMMKDHICVCRQAFSFSDPRTGAKMIKVKNWSFFFRMATVQLNQHVFCFSFFSHFVLKHPFNSTNIDLIPDILWQKKINFFFFHTWYNSYWNTLYCK